MGPVRARYLGRDEWVKVKDPVNKSATVMRRYTVGLTALLLQDIYVVEMNRAGPNGHHGRA